jgi:Ca-activated chloride channel family protein
VVNFSGNSYLDQDFTSDLGLPNELCIQRRCKAAQPSTTSIVAPATHLKNNLRLEKKILLVMTDGEDNMSRDTLQQARRSLQQENGPTLFAIGLMDEQTQYPGREALQKLADATGGSAFFPDRLDQVSDITRGLARDIRKQYIVNLSAARSKFERELPSHTGGSPRRGIRWLSVLEQESTPRSRSAEAPLLCWPPCRCCRVAFRSE